MVGGHSTTVLSSYWICLQTPARWLGMPTATLFNIRQAASMAGIAEGLLVFWINIGRFAPTIELATPTAKLDPILRSYAPDGQVFGWNRFTLTDEDVERLRGMVQATATATKSARVESAHTKGSHYSVQELATLWGIGVDKIRELFQNEPGVIKIQKPVKKGRRAYQTLRIPENVAERVQRRLS